MIKFNDLKITSRNQNYKLSREYPRLYRYIKDSILRRKPELPKILEVNLWNWDSKNSTSTGLSWRHNINSGIKQDFKIDLNLRQILYIYKNPDSINQKGRISPATIKGIRKFILFVIYHELGHYVLKQKQEFNSIEQCSEKSEIFADSFAFDTLTQGQKDFGFIIPEIYPRGSLIPITSALLPKKLSVKVLRAFDKELGAIRARGKDSRGVLLFTGDNKKIKLYHYSNQDFKGYIKPDYFGQNNFTKNSARLSGINRSFFYTGRGKEYFFEGVKFCYIAEIEEFKLYDIIKDEKKLIKFTLEKGLGNDIFSICKKLGYWGVVGNNGYDVICLFKKIKYIDKRAV